MRLPSAYGMGNLARQNKTSLATGIPVGTPPMLLLLAVLDHDDVIAEIRFDSFPVRSVDRARRQLKGNLLKLGIQTPLGLPAERSSCRPFV